MGTESILCWNVRGLNLNGRRDVVHYLVAVEWLSIMCLQETKRDVFSDYGIMQLLRRGFDYYYIGILKSWSNHCIGNIRTQLEVAKEVVHRLEMAHDRWPLVLHEESLRQQLKLKTLGLSSLQRTVARQESRLLWFSEGDAPAKFFHSQANGRQRRNHIHSLVHDGQMLTSETDKDWIKYTSCF
jgi:hypothetical protein